MISAGCAGAMLAGSSAIMIPRPHDALFKSAFEAPAAAAALLRELLPVLLRGENRLKPAVSGVRPDSGRPRSPAGHSGHSTP